jgi:hypothetical protein
MTVSEPLPVHEVVIESVPRTAKAPIVVFPAPDALTTVAVVGVARGLPLPQALHARPAANKTTVPAAFLTHVELVTYGPGDQTPRARTGR